MTKTALLAAWISMSVGASTTALAQDQESGDIDVNLPARRVEAPAETGPRSSVNPGPLRVYAGMSVAVGGELQYENDVQEFSFDLDPTVGLQAGADYVIMDYFAIGGETRFLFAKADGAGERTLLWDLVVKPRGRYVFSKFPLEVYGTLPLGLTVPESENGTDRNVGWTIGLLAGANWFFTEHLGVNAEMGWIFHKWGYEDGAFETDVKMNQFLLLCPNFVYAF